MQRNGYGWKVNVKWCFCTNNVGNAVGKSVFCSFRIKFPHFTFSCLIIGSTSWIQRLLATLKKIESISVSLTETNLEKWRIFLFFLEQQFLCFWPSFPPIKLCRKARVACFWIQPKKTGTKQIGSQKGKFGLSDAFFGRFNELKPCVVNRTLKNEAFIS